jgi:hypothetical protein
MIDHKPPDQREAQRKAKADRPAFEAYIERLKADPRFKAIEPTGQAFIIGGQNPAHPKPKPI